MVLRYSANIFLILFLFAAGKSFAPAFFKPLSLLNIHIISLIFILTIFGLKPAFFWAASFGALSDIFSFAPFGLFLFLYGALALFLDFLHNNFFTNRSLYSFWMLTVFSFVFYRCALYLSERILEAGSGLPALSAQFGKNALVLEFSGLLINLAAVTAVFYSVNYLSKRLRPDFLLKK